MFVCMCVSVCGSVGKHRIEYYVICLNDEDVLKLGKSVLDRMDMPVSVYLYLDDRHTFKVRWKA